MLANLTENQTYNLPSTISIRPSIKFETMLLEKLEWAEIRRQVEVLCSMLPDQVLNYPVVPKSKQEDFTGFFLYGTFSGLATFCENYNRAKSGGFTNLTATLNAYMGSLIEIIYFYKGDLVKLNMFDFLVVWKEADAEDFEKLTQDAFSCALAIQRIIGNFFTETEVFLHIKLFIGYGYLKFVIVGEESKDYFILGPSLSEARSFLEDSEEDVIILSRSLDKMVRGKKFDCVRHGDVCHLINIAYTAEQSVLYGKKSEILRDYCKKHFLRREAIHKKYFEQSEIDVQPIERLQRNLPDKYVTRFSPLKMYYFHLRSFIFPRVYEKTDNNLPVDELDGFFNTTIQFVYLIPNSLDYDIFAEKLANVYSNITKLVRNFHGISEKLLFIEETVVLVSYFGFKGVKPYLQIQNCLKSSVAVKTFLEKEEKFFNFSIAIFDSQVYTATLGHPMRKEYFTIAYTFNRMLRVTKKYQKIITSDYRTFKRSKVSSEHFKLLPSPDLDVDYVFEFDPDIQQNVEKEKIFIGRDTELNLINAVILNPDGVGDYYGLCFYSKMHMGKSELLKQAYNQAKQTENILASVILPDGPQRPYFCLSMIYKQLYNFKTRFQSDEVKLIEDLPPDLWDISEILQCHKLDKKFVFETKVRMTTTLREVLTASNQDDYAIIFIDNIEYIDISSLEMLHMLLNEGLVRLVCAGTFMEESTFDIRYKFSLCDKIKFLELDEIEDCYMDELMEDVLKVPPSEELRQFLKKMCGGNPGLIKLTINNFMKKEIIEIEEEIKEEQLEVGRKAVLRKEKLPKEQISFQSIYCDILMAFSNNEQSVITTSVVLGSVFKRSVLKKLLDEPPDAFLALAMIHLFEAEIFDCASKYFSDNSFEMKSMNCACCLDDAVVSELNFQVGYKLPKYAHCEMIYFKDRHIKKVVYDVIEKTERDQLHLQLTNLLEEQSFCCLFCQNNGLCDTFSLKKFRQFLCKFNEPHIIYTEENQCSDLAKQPDYIKNIIRKELRKAVQEDDSTWEINGLMGFQSKKLKPFDTMYCYCIDFLIRTYHYLIENSRHAGHEAKRVFFLHHYATILITLTEYNQALDILKEVEDLCTLENLSRSKFIISENFRIFLNIKTRKLIAEVYYRLANLKESKLMVSRSLDELKREEKNLMPNSNSLMSKIFSKTILRKFSSFQPCKSSIGAVFKAEVASCYDLISKIFLCEEKQQLSLFACMKSYHVLSGQKDDVSLACCIQGNALQVCCRESNSEISQNLVRIALKVFQNPRKKFDLQDLFAMTSLAVKIFETKILSGDLENSLHLGFKVLEMCRKLSAHNLYVNTASILTSCLLYVQRINDATFLMKYVQILGKTVNNKFLLYYYIFCLELLVETGFLLEPFEKIMEFAEKFFVTPNIQKSEYETKFLILIFTYYLRSNQYKDAMKYKSLISDIVIDHPSYVTASNILRYTECLMVASALNLADSKTVISERKEFKNYIVSCDTIATRWNLFLPRYLHYKAYNCQLSGKKRQVKKILKEAMSIAKGQGNFLEYSWLISSENSWQNFQVSSDQKDILWSEASTYNLTQWSHILFTLPAYV